MSPSRKTKASYKVGERKKKEEGKARAHKARLARGRSTKKIKPRRKQQAGSGQPAAPELREDGTVRLNKYLADHGIASRRKSDELIAGGFVLVDGEPVVELGTRIDPTTQRVEAKGTLIQPESSLEKRYYLLNKPKGVVCTNESRERKQRAVDLVNDKAKGRIYTVGRLDEESEGLILLTNDGDFAHRVMHPSFGIEKSYRVKLRGNLEGEALERVREGVQLAEGRTGGARVTVRKRGRDYTHVVVTLTEGMNREIRRVFAKVGYKVAGLERSRIGNLTGRGLRSGWWRRLKPAEVRDLLAGAPEQEQTDKRLRGRGQKKSSKGGSGRTRVAASRRGAARPTGGRGGGRTTPGQRKRKR
jgi:23S rRNA pseudouridine2605 synthase